MQTILDIGEKSLKQIIPLMTSSRYKGQNGKVGVIGGSFEYTGAPFYSASSVLKGGGDLSHIFCTESAATPIKSYSPEIIVHPYLISEEELKRKVEPEEVDKCIKSITKWYDALHSVVIGPGLGRDNATSLFIEQIFENLKEKISVCDADFTWFLTEKNKETLIEKLKKRSKYTILTPNKVEFTRLWKYFKGDERENESEFTKLSEKSDVVELSIDHPLVKDTAELSRGVFDVITDGKKALIVKREGAGKRCGGQGDILAGLTALYSYWDYSYQSNFDSENFNLLNGCALASLVTRKSAHIAYEIHKLGLTTVEILKEVPVAINSLAFSHDEHIQPKL